MHTDMIVLCTPHKDVYIDVACICFANKRNINFIRMNCQENQSYALIPSVSQCSVVAIKYLMQQST